MTAILVTFLLVGHDVMVAFGISIPGIRIAGGLVIGFLGFRMLFPDEGQLPGRREAGGAAKAGQFVQSTRHAELERPGFHGGRHYHVVIHQWTARQ